MPTCIATTGLNIGDVTNSVISVMGSVAYLKAFIPTAVTNIIQNRIDFDAKYFDQRKLNGVPYKTFSKRIPKKHPLFDVYHWMRGALGDLDKKYIKELLLIVRKKDTKDIIEHYTFAIKYTEVDGKPKSKVVSEEIMVNTSKLFETINLLGGQEKLKGDDISFAMQVNLNDDAPDNYVTKSFERSKPYLDPETNDMISVGTIFTGYHKLKILAKGDVFHVEDENENVEITEVHNKNIEELLNKEDSDDEELDDDDAVMKEVMEDEDFEITEVYRKPNARKRKVTTSAKNVKGKEKENKVVKKGPGRKKGVSNNTKKEKLRCDENSGNTIEQIINNSQTTGGPKKNVSIICLCTISYDINKVGLVVCSVCGKNQHSACIGYRSKANAQKPHVCFKCHKETGAKMLDTHMYNAKSDNMRLIIALLRLVSVYCHNSDESPETIIDLLAVNTQQYAFNELLKYGVIQKKDGKITANQAKISTTLGSVLFYNNVDSMELDASEVTYVDTH